VFDTGLKKMMIQILRLILNDNVKARELMPNGMYMRINNELTPFRSQFEAMDITSWKRLQLLQ
jgi:polyphosphate kinase